MLIEIELFEDIMAATTVVDVIVVVDVVVVEVAVVESVVLKKQLNNGAQFYIGTGAESATNLSST